MAVNRLLFQPIMNTTTTQGVIWSVIIPGQDSMLQIIITIVIGQVCIAGLYNKQGMCQPLHGELFDKRLCAQFFSVCQENSCWDDGNSGAWYQ